MAQNEETAPYYNLGPETILDAVESAGFPCDGRLLALNSYENRVYQVGLEAGGFLVAKFYRPGRWSDAAILEEHAFCEELAELEIPVVPALRDEQGASLWRWESFRFALFPRQGGRAPDLEAPQHLKRLGRLLGRIHAVGRTRPFLERPTLNIDSFGVASSAFLRDSGFIPNDLREAYLTLVEDVLVRIRACFDSAGSVASIRLHGDCHAGNILWTDDGPHFVDFDDARMGPAVQDLWMCLSGERVERMDQLGELLDGYAQFHTFDPRQLRLIEALRTLRIMHHAAWIGQRWEDPAFERAFPWFNGPRYWEEHILSLREQAAMMEEAPLIWDPY